MTALSLQRHLNDRAILLIRSLARRISLINWRLLKSKTIPRPLTAFVRVPSLSRIVRDLRDCRDLRCIFAKAYVKLCTFFETSILAKAFLDSGSERSFITWNTLNLRIQTNTVKYVHIYCVIGIDLFFHVLRDDLKLGHLNIPTALNSCFGWIAFVHHTDRWNSVYK